MSITKITIEDVTRYVIAKDDEITDLKALVSWNDAEIERLKALLARAADALDAWNCAGFYDKLIAELRKAAQ